MKSYVELTRGSKSYEILQLFIFFLLHSFSNKISLKKKKELKFPTFCPEAGWRITNSEAPKKWNLIFIWLLPGNCKLKILYIFNSWFFLYLICKCLIGAAKRLEYKSTFVIDMAQNRKIERHPVQGWNLN